MHRRADAAVVTCRVADEHDAVGVDRSGRDLAALAPRADLGLPDLLAGLLVERDDVAVARTVEDLPSPSATPGCRPAGGVPPAGTKPASYVGVYFQSCWPVVASSAKVSPFGVVVVGALVNDSVGLERAARRVLRADRTRPEVDVPRLLRVATFDLLICVNDE